MAAMAESVQEKEKPQVFLESDDEIRGQKYVCLSFLTPNRGLLRRKDLYFFAEFLKFYALDYKVKATESFVLGELRGVQDALSNAILTIANSNLTDVSGNAQVQKDLVASIEKLRSDLAQRTAADLEAHVKANLGDFRESSINEEYEKWMVTSRQRLEDAFHKENNFQTSIHGLKVRGVYSNHDQATARAKALSKKDPYFNVYVADVGEWLPWDPEPEDVEDSEYQNDELNKLMKSYKDNAAKREAFFEEDKRQKMAEAAGAAEKGKAAQAAERAARHAAFGLQDKEQEAGEAGADMFAGGDLAMARKATTATTATAPASVSETSASVSETSPALAVSAVPALAVSEVPALAVSAAVEPLD